MSNLKNFSLIVPCAADRPEYQDRIPSVFLLDNEGVMRCVRSILGLNLEVFDTIYFTILRKHADDYDVDAMLSLQFRRLGLENVKVVILDNPTSTQAETIACTIEGEKINGSIFIKDADCYFKAEIYPENGVAVYPLENLNLVDPRHKSYVAVDDMQHITNIIEKRVVSHLFNAGGYCFEDTRLFMKAYQNYRHLGQIYISHLIYSLLLNRELFHPIQVEEYTDWNIES